ncbi:MAG: hypothetical protein HC915_11345, partial [Anaerolineae bacterium]|nr:hypothetical protein [Anaerolineae bacterium]
MMRLTHVFHWNSWRWLALLLIGLVLAGAAPRTQAHGYIVRSIPEDRSVVGRAPNQVQVWFSEGLEPRFSTIAVYNQSGDRVDLGESGVDPRNSTRLIAALPGDLPQGAYLVRLRPVFTSDGHAVSDTLVFWVGEQVGNVEAGGASGAAVTGEVLWRVALNLALILLAGAYWTYALVLRPAWQNPRYALGNLPPRVMQRLSGLVWAGLGMALSVNLVALFQISTRLFEAPLQTVLRDNLWEIVLQGTNFGDVWQVRMGLLVFMLLIQVVAAQQARNRPGSTHVLWLVNGTLVLPLLATQSLISHAAGAPLWGVGGLAGGVWPSGGGGGLDWRGVGAGAGATPGACAAGRRRT